MTITKPSLYDYVGDTCRKVESEKREEIKNAWAKLVTPHLELDIVKAFEKLDGAEAILKVAKETVIELHTVFPNYAYADYYATKTVDALPNWKVHDLLKSVTQNEVDNFFTYVSNYGELPKHTPWLDQSSIPSIKTAIAEWGKIRDVLKGDIERIRTLRREAMAVARGSKSGKQGYANLVSLEFPMDNYVAPVKERALTIQKFTTDPCVLTGTCKEQEEATKA